MPASLGGHEPRATQRAARTPRLSVITPGGTASAGGLLQSEGARSVLRQLATRTRYVIVDAPSTAAGADAQSKNQTLTSIFDPFTNAGAAVLGAGDDVDLLTDFDQYYRSVNYLLTSNFVDFLQVRGKARVLRNESIMVKSANPAFIAADDNIVAPVSTGGSYDRNAITRIRFNQPGFVGDGGTSEPDFHAALTFAGVWRAPVVFVIQNNQWAISVPVAAQSASPTLAVKAHAYGVPGVRVDGNDLLAVYREVRAAADRARRGDGPTLVELVTFRMGGHSSADDPTRYRDPALVAAWEARCPLRRLRAWLEANPRPPCGVADVANHVEHVRAVAGIDHVGLGGDFDGVAAMPDGLQGVDGYPVLLAELAQRGWSDAELAKLTWHNAVRVLRDTEAAARSAQQQRGPSLATLPRR